MTGAHHHDAEIELPCALVGDDTEVPCVDGISRRYLNLDAAASTSALPAVASRVHDFMPWYSSVHRGAGYKSRASTDAYERARAAILRFAGRPVDGDDIAIICRNTTEAINHLAYRLRLDADDVVVTTVVEHHANLLPWARACRRRFVECSPDGTVDLDDVTAALDAAPRPKLLAITGGSNVTGWIPPIDDIARAHTNATSPSSWMPPSSHPIDPCPPRLTSSHGAATRCTRRSVRARSSDPGVHSSTANPSSPEAARSISWTSTRSCGPIHPNAKKPAPPTWSARSHCTPRSTSSTASDGHKSSTTTSRSPLDFAQHSPRFPVYICSARISQPKPCRSPRSPSTACTIRWSRRA